MADYVTTFMDRVAAGLGVRAPRDRTVSFLRMWAGREGVPQNIDRYNLLGTTLRVGNSYGTNGPGVQSYGSLDDGVHAHVLMLQQSNFTGIRNALLSGNPDAYRNDPEVAREMLSWSGGGYSWPDSSSPAIQAPGSATARTRGPRPTKGGGGVLGTIEGAAGGIIDTGLFGGLPVSQVWGSVFGGGGLGGIVDFLKAALWLVDPRNWLRMFEMFLSVLLCMTGIYYIGKAAADKGTVSGPIGKLPGVLPAARATKAVVGARAARTEKRYVSRSYSRSREGIAKSDRTKPGFAGVGGRKRKPPRGTPGSTKLTRGDRVPF